MKKEKELKKQSSALISGVSFILVLMLMCYFGVTNTKVTHSAEAEDNFFIAEIDGKKYSKSCAITANNNTHFQEIVVCFSNKILEADGGSVEKLIKEDFSDQKTNYSNIKDYKLITSENQIQGCLEDPITPTEQTCKEGQSAYQCYIACPLSEVKVIFKLDSNTILSEKYLPSPGAKLSYFDGFPGMQDNKEHTTEIENYLSRKHKKIVGWSRDENCTKDGKSTNIFEDFQDYISLSEEVTIFYACLDYEYEYKIKYSRIPSEILLDKSLPKGYNTGESLVYSNSATISGFKGFSLTSECEKINETEISIPTGYTGDITFHGCWDSEAITNKANFYLNDTEDTIYKSVACRPQGSATSCQITLPILPTRDELIEEGIIGYEAKWWIDQNHIYKTGGDFETLKTDNIKYYLDLSPVTYSITYSDGTETIEVKDAPKSYTYGTDLEINATPQTKDGYEFQGWVKLGTDPDNATKNYNIKDKYAFECSPGCTCKDMIFLEAVYKKIYSATFNLTDGSTEIEYCPGCYKLNAVDDYNDDPYFYGWVQGNDYNKCTVSTSKKYKNEQVPTERSYFPCFEYSINYKEPGATNTISLDGLPASYTFGIGATISKDKTPIKEGYTFKGWITENNSNKCSTAEIKDIKITSTDNGSKTYYACWTQNSVTPTEKTLTAEFIDGSNTTTKTCTTKTSSSCEIEKVTGPTEQTGYTVKGWSTQKNDTTCSNIIEVYTANESEQPTKYYACRIANEYSIKYYSDGSEVTNFASGEHPEKYTYGVGATITATLTKNNYDFIGWKIGASGACPTNWTKTTIQKTENKDISLYACWTQNSVTPTEKTLTAEFIDGSNTTTKTCTTTSSSCKITEKVTDPTEKTGYTVKGWSTKENDTTCSNIIEVYTANESEQPTKYYACRIANEYSIKYYSDGSEVTNFASGEHPEKYTYGVGASITAKLTKDNYDFIGWKIGASGACPTNWTKTTILANHFDDKSLYACWKAKTYTITYYKEPGATNKISVDGLPTTYTFGSGEKISKDKTPINYGYTFKGWITENNSSKCSTAEIKDIIITSTDNGNKTYYACWNKNRQLTQSYYPTDNSSTPQNIQCTELSFNAGRKCTPKPNDPSRDGYAFNGWNIGAVCPDNQKGTSYEDLATPTNEQTNYYACWTKENDKCDGKTTFTTDAICRGKFPGYNCKPSNECYVKDSPINYTITYYDGQKQISADKAHGLPGTYTINDSVTINGKLADTNEKIFAGWSSIANNCSNANLPITIDKGSTEHKKYYACWTPLKSYTATYYNGSTKLTSTNCTETALNKGCTPALPESNPSNSDQKFIGWGKDNNCTNPIKTKSDMKPITSNTNYYACFEDNDVACYKDSKGSYTWTNNILEGYTPITNATDKQTCLVNNCKEAERSEELCKKANDGSDCVRNDTTYCWTKAEVKCDYNKKEDCEAKFDGFNCKQDKNNCWEKGDAKEPTVNPKTGTATTVAVLVTGIAMIGYAAWYFTKSKITLKK